jgi:hypothetical protein
MTSRVEASSMFRRSREVILREKRGKQKVEKLVRKFEDLGATCNK